MFSLAVPDGEPAESFPVTRSRPGLVRIWVGPAPFAPGSWPDLFWEPACSATGLLLNFIQGLTAWYFAYCSAPAYLRSFSRASLSHGPFATRPYSRFYLDRPGLQPEFAQVHSRQSAPGQNILVNFLNFFLSGLFRLLKGPVQDRKSTRLNSSHVAISYAVFCLK